MNKLSSFLVLILTINSIIAQEKTIADFTISFGSCNNQNIENVLWKEITKNNPDIWIWGGDIVYSDTYDMSVLQQSYKQQSNQPAYTLFKKNTPILGTWDDHDYGLNDGGREYEKREESQQLFLDFIGVSKEDSRRKREGVYHSQVYKTKKGVVKVIILDTRYFRSSLTKAANPNKRYQPDTSGKGTILGTKQWKWLTNELTTSTADFNVIVSSIQIFAYLHGFETWGNLPHEVEKLTSLIKSSKAKGVILLSGDRHISEFTQIQKTGMSYPIIDFTSSGLTHSYSSFTGETNPNRLGKVVPVISFGLLKFDFDNKKVTMQMRGKQNKLQQEHIQVYN